MTWIKTVSPQKDNEVAAAMEATMSLYPPEYAIPVDNLRMHNSQDGAGIVLSHSLLPKVLMHMFSAYGELLSPDLPLTRQEHEMIAATVSSLNDCFY